MDFAFELLIMILQRGYEVTHLPIDGTRLLISSKLLFEFDTQHLVLFSHLGKHVLELNDFGTKLLLTQQLVALLRKKSFELLSLGEKSSKLNQYLHHFNLTKVGILCRMPMLPCFVQLCLETHRFIVEYREL